MALPRKKYSPYLFALIAAFAALILYWPSLSLPLIYDDLLHIRIAGELNLASVWLPTESFGFYRPLTFLPLLLIEGIVGRYPPALLHGLNLLQHALNAALLVLLAWRLWRHAGRALAAGLLMACFPFSYQAIAVYGHNVHPTTTGIILLALHTYLSARREFIWEVGPWRPGRRFWWSLTALLFVLGLLSHESAILFGPLAFLLEWAAEGSSPLRRRRSWTGLLHAPWFIFTAAGIGYLASYQLLPLSRAPQADSGGGVWTAKGIYLLQGAVYGFVWPARFFPARAGSWLIMTSGLLALILLGMSARRPANRPALLLGAGWWALASLLLAIPLSANYLLHGPRLLYLSSAGLALLWPILLEPLGRLARPLPVLILTIILMQNWIFVREKLQVYQVLTSPVEEVARVMAGRPTNEGILLINLPQWMAPERNTFPAGVEIAAMLGDYLFAEELIADNLGSKYNVRAIALPELLRQPTGYRFGVHAQDTLDSTALTAMPIAQHIFLIQYGESGPQTVYLGALTPGKTVADPLAGFQTLDLLGANAEVCADQIVVKLTWRRAGEMPPTSTTSIFVQIVDDAGNLLAQADGPPLGLRPDLLVVDEGWELQDRRAVQVASESMPDAVLVGVYDFVTGIRQAGIDPDGEPLPDDALRLPLERCSEEPGLLPD